ncbi:MAG: (Fe-S)-binding protein, partial [Candidatus Bathyarchaeia archaeon]
MSRKVQPLQIYMLLPRRNCGRCGVTTCLAFAAKLTSGEATPDLCPFLTPQSKAKISALIMPPVRPIPISSLSSTIEVGGEEGLFRHDGGFRREARLAYTIDL